VVRRVQRGPRPGVAVAGYVLRRVHARLLLLDVAPLLVHLDQSAGEVTHKAIVETLGAAADEHAEAHDGVAVDLRHALHGADRVAIYERCEDAQTLLSREDVRHEGLPSSKRCAILDLARARGGRPLRVLEPRESDQLSRGSFRSGNYYINETPCFTG
jgi:hypothetical protein